jgi:serine beta-lactamase-like protein LACTB
MLPLGLLSRSFALAVATALASVPIEGQQARWTDAVERGRQAMRHLVETGAVPGASVAVAVHGKIVWAEAFGFADLEQRIPAGRQTRFGLGSITKTLTMAAVLTLVDEGRLDLDAPVERYLPDFPHRGRGITIRRIASHQSGMEDEFANRHYDTGTHFPTLDSAYQHIKQERIAYPPGSDTLYATGLYTIIGRILERVEGEPYMEIMRRRVFEPSAMKNAVPNDPTSPTPDRAQFYVRGAGGRFTPGVRADPSFKLPGAGYLSTAEDAARFGAALLDSAILSAEARAAMFRMVPLTDGSPTNFGLGVRLLREGNRRPVHQPGGGIGISSSVFLYPDERMVVAILSNVTGGPLGDTRKAITDAFLQAIDSGSLRH